MAPALPRGKTVKNDQKTTSNICPSKLTLAFFNFFMVIPSGTFHSCSKNSIVGKRQWINLSKREVIPRPLVQNFELV